MKKIFLIIFFIVSVNNVSASIKDNIINKLKDIENISFNFEQNINGKIENGNCIIEYPKKIFCKYDLSNQKILVSNGKSLVIKTLSSYYHYSLKKTPLNLILNKSFLLKKFKEIDGTLIEEKYYTFSIKYENNSVDIFFDNKNYNIIGWQTEDIYKNLAVTYIYNLKINEKINEKLFLLPKAY